MENNNFNDLVDLVRTYVKEQDDKDQQEYYETNQDRVSGVLIYGFLPWLYEKTEDGRTTRRLIEAAKSHIEKLEAQKDHWEKTFENIFESKS